MSLKRQLITWDGGLQSYPETKPDNCPDSIVNYEYLQEGRLDLRVKAVTYDSNLDTAVSACFESDNRKLAPKLFYPSIQPANSIIDFLIPIFGNFTNDIWKLALFYKTDSSTWTYDTLDDLENDGIVFTADSILRYAFMGNTIFFTDNINKLGFATVDKDGIVQSGVRGIPAPKTMPSLDASNRATDTITDKTCNIGIIQLCFTVSTEDGYESNPSATRSYEYQWNKIDSEGEFERWIDNFLVKYVKPPYGINSYIQNKLKYFNFYYRVYSYSASANVENMTYSCRKEIVNKVFDADNDEGNTYTIATANGITAVSSENDIAPMSKDVITVDDCVLLSQTQSPIKFPYHFDNVWKIKLNNQNTKNYVDGVVRIRLYDNNSSDDKKITDLDWGNFDTESDNTISDNNIHLLRIYDSDLITPLSVVYDLHTGGSDNYCDVWIRFTQIPTNSLKTVYFCFTASGSGGVNNSYYNTSTYGKWRDINTSGDWLLQTAFNSIRIPDSDCLVCSPMNEASWSENVPNKANANYNGTLSDADWVEDGAIARLSDFTANIIGNDCVGVNSIQGNIDYGDLGLTTIPDKGYVFGFIKYKGSVYPNRFWSIFGFHKSTNFMQFGFNSSDLEWKVVTNDGDFEFLNCDIKPFYGGGYHTLFILFSWDNDNEKASIFVMNDNNFGYDEIDMTGGSFEFDDEYFNLGDKTSSILGAYYDQWQLVQNKYFDGSDNDDISNVRNISNFMPTYDEFLGHKYALKYTGSVTFSSPGGNLKICLNDGVDYTDIINNSMLVTLTDCSVNSGQYDIDSVVYSTNTYIGISESLSLGTISGTVSVGTHNNNITFEEVDQDEKPINLLRWSKKGAWSYPDTYYKSGIPSPILRILLSSSSHRLQSQNIIKLYLRNGLYKFIISGDPSTWTTLTDNLIRQSPNLGLLGEEAVVSTPFGELHRSEAGIILWDGDNIEIVSEKDGHKIIDIDLDKTVYFYYCPLRKQLHIQLIEEEPVAFYTGKTDTDEKKIIITEDGKIITIPI